MFLIAISRPGIAQISETAGEPTRAASVMSAEQARETVQTLVDMAITILPHEHDGKKHWEKTKRVWSGIRFKRDGLRISTNRRWREVRHGLQSHYKVSFPGDASARPPIVATVRSVAHLSGDENQSPGWEIQCDLATPLDFSARIERWNLGARLYSVEISGHMNVRMTLAGRLSSYPDYSVLPPAIVIDPTVTSASLQLESLHVDRVSKIGGEVAETWGEIAEAIVKEVFLEDINGKLHTKINKAIDKKRDRLRFSASDWVSGLMSE